MLNTARVIFTKPLLKATHAHMESYTPKHDAFILIANHSDPLDPGFEMIALKRYVRFVASDHLVRANKLGGKVITKLGGVIIKHRDKPSSVLTDEIKANVAAGIPVGIHAEGGTSVNGETGFVSEHTGQLVKDSGAALITFRFTGGYLRTPRWAKSSRKGPLFGKVVNEYSPEKLSNMTVSEITDIIRRDIYVNVYDEQRKNPHEYTGEALAEYVERTLYMCPECKEVGSLHSSGDILKCDSCGYTVSLGTDAFFHDAGTGLVFDNVCDWDKWQREEWKKRVLSFPAGELIFKENGQIINSIKGEEKTALYDNAVLELYTDKIVIDMKENGMIALPLSGLKSVQTASKEGLIIINDEYYLDIRCQKPRAAAKYAAAWRYLTGKEYY